MTNAEWVASRNAANSGNVNLVRVNSSNLIEFGATITSPTISGGSITGITDLAVADGGTGASTAAAAATNLGLGTGDSPQFTAVNVGNASDTTITRPSAGDISVEGNIVYRAGGTDVPLTDGGTGASSASAARTDLGLVNGTDVAAFSHTHTPTDMVQVPIGDGTNAIGTGIYVDIHFAHAATITKWRILGTKFTSGSTGSIVLDLWKDTYANFPPVVGDTITASAKPTVTTAAKAESSTLTGWTTSVAAGDVIRVNVDSAATFSLVTFALEYTKTV